MSDLLPVRMQIDVLVAASQREYDNGDLWDRTDAALGRAGFICEGGSACVMEASAVIPNSRLAHQLAGPGHGKEPL